MKAQVLGLLFFLSPHIVITLQSPTEWSGFKADSPRDTRVLSTEDFRKYNSKNSPPKFVQELCIKYAVTNNLIDWDDVLVPKSHICFRALLIFYAAKGDPIVIEKKRAIFRRSSGKGKPPNPPLQHLDETSKGLQNTTQNVPKPPSEEYESFGVPLDFPDEDLLGMEGRARSPGNGRQRVQRPKDTLTDVNIPMMNHPLSNQPSLSEPSQRGGKKDFVPLLNTGVSSNEVFSTQDNGMSKPPNSGESSKTGGIANWVFITIGTSAAVVCFSIFLLSYMYRLRMAQDQSLRKQHHGKGEPDRADSLLRPDCEQALSHDVDVMPMARLASSYSLESYYDNRGGTHEPAILEQESELQQCNSSSKLLTRCLSGQSEDINRDRAESTGSIYNMVKNDGNKLRGGNVDFHRRYVDNPYLCDDLEKRLDVKKSKRHRNFERLQLNPPGLSNRVANPDSGWNGSSASSTTSHHSARSYISIPPTSPSNNYIEAGSDCTSLLSTKSMSPIKMEWLTKSFSLNPKNEISSYQASTGVQTEDSVSPPTSKTVLGTPWQFGGAFTCKGGLLQARRSDVVLSVPFGAVSRGQAIDIYGSIFTDTADVRRKIEFPNEESLVTPVVEYLALPVNDFKRPLHLHLPHSLSAEFDVTSVKVYTFSVDELGGVTTKCLPFQDHSGTIDDQEAFWEKSQDGNKIIITTSHFSGYFCTLCKTTSLPSICTMVFGSHVEISPHRREIRVILYIWDRRLTIKDYLERFQKQESEVDRQLLTDMQVPLLNDASSDSRLVMRMEIMGSEEDRQCWRHVARPGGSRLLFKPLQVRRLSEIVQCCRQTDPVRVEWAVENRPDVSPGPVFQCCIDILHTPESICDYEAALSEDLDDLVRTFYVRDLKVMSKQEDTEPPRSFNFEPATLKRTLSEALDLKQTEQLCCELGISSKDIGNFHKKFTSDSEVQVQLVEECLRRFGHEKFVSHLPMILDKLKLPKDLGIVESKASNLGPPLKPTSPGGKESKGEESSLTACKSIDSSISSHSPNKNRIAYDCKSQNVNIQHHHLPEKSDAFFHDGSSLDFHSQYKEEGLLHSNASASKSGASALNLSGAYSVDLEPQLASNQDHHNHHHAATNKLNSSSGYASGNHHGAQSSHSLSLTHNNNLHSVDICSVVAHADTLEVPESNIQLPHYPSNNNQAYPEVTEELCVSTSGPQAFAGHKAFGPKDSNLHDHREQTSKKEVFGIHTIV
ncbi:hypothetical protein ElyMa_004649300 [Elysia marginata]|uniref:ZU5 domain-containing protein n=1 Tax=Elysia marginata TaxID=1093978 RepID=A0AAV4I0Y8_9GAST|nr:hypothetical protein ElyMa_004649300 [Elysia marginata]